MDVELVQSITGDISYLVNRMIQKSQPQQQEGKEVGLLVKRFFTGDRHWTSLTRTELTTRGVRTPSSIIISQLGRHIIHQNPHFLRNIFDGVYPCYEVEEGSLAVVSSDSQVRLAFVNYNKQEYPVVLKFHGEGDACYEHYRESITTKSFPDFVNGIDNFLALRAIQRFSTGLLIPEPILATERIFVASFVAGDLMQEKVSWLDRLIAVCMRIELPDQGSTVPGWVKSEVGRAINRAYQLGWLQKPYRRFGLWPKRYRIDLDTVGNVLRTPQGFCVVDPIL